MANNKRSSIYEKVRIGILAFLLGSLTAFCISIWADKTFRTDKDRSEESREYRERVVDSERRLEAISARCRSIEEQLGSSEQSIHGIVERLYTIAEEVEQIEHLADNNLSSCSRSSIRSSNLLLVESLEVYDGVENYGW